MEQSQAKKGGTCRKRVLLNNIAGAWMGDKETKTMSKQPLVSAWMQDHGIDMAMLSEVG